MVSELTLKVGWVGVTQLIYRGNISPVLGVYTVAKWPVFV